MYSALISVVLATSALTGLGDDEAPGYYGGYGSYGGYGLDGMSGNSRIGAGLIWPGGYGQPSVYNDVNNNCQKRLAELEKCFKDLCKDYQNLSQKLKDIEKKTEEDNRAIEFSQQMEKRLQQFQKDMVSAIADANANKVPSSPPPGFEDLRAQVNRIEVYLGKLDQTQPQAVSQQNNAPKDARIEALMLFLKEKFGNDATTAALDRIAKQLEGLKSEGQMGNNLGGTKLSRGMIIVNLPSDATLYVNELESKPGSNVRSFISPDLEKGKAYFYTLASN